MNDNDMVETADILQLTPGQMIKAARQAKQISLHDVSQKLLLSKRILTAVEEDDYSRIPAAVYAEGYLRAYAKLLQISADELIKNFRLLNAYPSSNIKTEVESQKKIDLSKLLKPILYLKGFYGLLLLVLVLIVILGSIGFVTKMIKTKTETITPESSSIVETEVGGSGLSSSSNNEDVEESDSNRRRGDLLSPLMERNSLNISIPLGANESTNSVEE